MLIRAFQGVVSASIFTMSITLASLTLPRAEIDRGIGTYLASTSLGLLVGPLITTFSIPLFGVSNTFYFASIAAILGCCTAFFLVKKIFSIEKRWHILERDIKREGVRNKLLKIIRNRSFAMAFIGNFAFFSFFSIFLAYGPIYAKNTLNFSTEQVSVLFFAYYAVTTITRFSLNRILEKISKVKLLIINAILVSVLSYMLTLKADLFFALVFSCIGTAQGSFYAVGSMLIAENIHPQRKMLANSVFGVGLGVGQAIAPLITAVFISLYGLDFGFLFSAVILSISAGLIVLISLTKG
jgi:predicted MFS family arabinose efflux permease